jgi:hypothetical protein
VYDTTFAITAEAEVMKCLKAWQEAQAQYGFDADEANKTSEVFSQSLSLGFFGCNDFWQEERDYTCFDIFSEHDTFQRMGHSHSETFINALEHGSVYGEKGDVTVRFRGGTYGALIEITDPGSGRIESPLTMEEIIARLARAGKVFKEPASSYGDVIRPMFTDDSSENPLGGGMGSIVLTVGKPVVGHHITESGYTVLLLYKPSLLPQHWKQELLKDEHDLSEEQKVLLRGEL